MGINERCQECGKIWTEEDEKRLDAEVKASMTVVPIEKEFNLSEKIKVLKLDKSGFARIVYVHATDIKEFIKRLKEELFEEARKRKLPLTASSLDRLSLKYIKQVIDKLAGDKLI